MRSLQLGIVFSIARTSPAAAPVAPAPEPSAADFAEQARSSILSLSRNMLCVSVQQKYSTTWQAEVEQALARVPLNV